MIIIRQKEFVTHKHKNQRLGGGVVQNDSAEVGNLTAGGKRHVNYIVETCPIVEDGEDRDNYIIDKIITSDGRKINKDLHSAAIAYYHQTKQSR